MNKVNKGYSLIELMIVLAIIGILAAVMSPRFLDYIAKAKWSAANAELYQLISNFDAKVSDGITPVMGVGGDNTLGMIDHSKNCSSIVPSYTPATMEGSLKCIVSGGPASVNGTTIIWSRDSNGRWTCSSTAAQTLIGQVVQCQGGA